MNLSIAYIAFLLVMLATISACAWINMNPGISSGVTGISSNIVASISSRRVGAKLQRTYPDIARKVHSVCSAIIESEALTHEIMDDLKKAVVTVSIEDKMLRADILDLLSLIKIVPDVEITQQQIVLIRTIATGLKTGIDLEV